MCGTAGVSRQEAMRSSQLAAHLPFHRSGMAGVPRRRQVAVVPLRPWWAPERALSPDGMLRDAIKSCASGRCSDRGQCPYGVRS